MYSIPMPLSMATTTTMMAPEATGLRRRLASFKPPESVSDMRVLHERDGESLSRGDDDDDDGGDGCEVLTRSFSSVSSHSSLSVESEYARADERLGGPDRNAGGSADAVAEAQRPSRLGSKIELTSSVHNDSPKESPGVSRTLPRFQRRASRSGTYVNRTHDRGSSSRSSWLGYDLSIIVALVSPIGNLLTGSDHVKNILLLLLLIYYLHQLVEVPWTLYRMSIPSQDPPSNDKNSVKHAVRAELRALELFYLVLTVLSPFLGATLLRCVATAISGNPEMLSWFSTSLFVLATGLRPWSHLVERLKDRSRALNALLEEDNDGKELGSSDVDARDVELERELGDLRGRLGVLDTRLTDLTTTCTREWDDLTDAVDDIETVLRKLRAESAKTVQAHNARLEALETHVHALQKGNASANEHGLRYKHAAYLRGRRLRALFWEVAALPWSVAAAAWAYSYWLLSRSDPRRARTGQLKITTMPPSATHGAPSLATILEEDSTSRGRVASTSLPTVDSDNTLVGEPNEAHSGVGELLMSAVLRVSAFVFSPIAFALRVMFLLFSIPQAAFRILL